MEINSRNVDGQTPLHRAAIKYNVTKITLEVTRLLLHYGADVHARDSSGKTASEVVDGDSHYKGDIRSLITQHALK